MIELFSLWPSPQEHRSHAHHRPIVPTHASHLCAQISASAVETFLLYAFVACACSVCPAGLSKTGASMPVLPHSASIRSACPRLEILICLSYCLSRSAATPGRENIDQIVTTSLRKPLPTTKKVHFMVLKLVLVLKTQ